MKKILVVEDDQFLVKVYQAKLTKEGFEVQVARDGEAVAEVLKNFVPDLILLDIILPKKDGFDVLQELKSSSTHKNIPVIVTSNLGQIEDKKKAMTLGASEFIVKSDVQIASIVEKIHTHLK